MAIKIRGENDNDIMVWLEPGYRPGTVRLMSGKDGNVAVELIIDSDGSTIVPEPTNLTWGHLK